MTECGNVTSSVRALGIDIGSSHVKAVVTCLGDDGMRELAVAERRTAGLDAAGLVAAALDAAREVLVASRAPVAVVGIASMAETGALIDSAGASGPLVRWDRRGNRASRPALATGLGAADLHAATGAPLVAKLPLLTWAALARDGLPHGVRWAFASDLVAAALTGRIATDHTLAGRSGAYRLPASGAPLPTGWDAALLDAAGVPPGLLGDVLMPGESVGGVLTGILPGATGVAVHIAGHDHAVAAWIAGARAAGPVVHSLGTTEAVVALAAPGRPVDRAAAAADGVSVVRAVDGVHEGVLAGSPAAGALIADWRVRARLAGADPDSLLAAVGATGAGGALALPYPRGRQSPRPDPDAAYALLDADPRDAASELTAIVRGLAAHGAWMRATVAGLTESGAHPAVAAVGTPVRNNDRLAGLIASLTGGPLPVVDLAAPVASGAAALAAERELAIGPVRAPFRVVDPQNDGMPDLAERFASAIAATAPATEGAR